MLNRTLTAIVCLAVLLGGCVSPPQKPLALSTESAGYKNVKIGIVVTQLPKVDMQFPGAGCLLCLMTASMANSTLSKYAETLPNSDILSIKNDLSKTLASKGADVVVIDDSLVLSNLPDAKTKGPGLASKDFSAIQQKYHLDKLVVVNIVVIGISRDYSAYIPTSDPKGKIVGQGFMVNLSTNAYEWYQDLSEAKSSDGVWDEPPSYPGLTNAYFQAIELTKDDVLKAFAN